MDSPSPSLPRSALLFDGLLPHHQFFLIVELNRPILSDKTQVRIGNILDLQSMACYNEHLYTNLELSESLVCLEERRQAFLEGEKNVHHMIPRSRGGANNHDNTIRRNKNWHELYHTALGTMHFGEQVQYLLRYDGFVFEKDIQGALRVISQLSCKKLFIPGIIKR